jgi:hypothetical protein
MPLEQTCISALAQFWGKVRRASLWLFRPRWVRRQAERRRGSCRQCARCCRLLVCCPHLRDDNRCAIYGSGRPPNCTSFPIDRRDLKDVGWQCGYYWPG